jgi:hypothetical protein
MAQMRTLSTRSQAQLGNEKRICQKERFLMNKFEQALIEGAKAAQEDYGEITGGWWLSYGPESFIGHTIANKLRKEGFLVFPEASPKKIREEMDDPPKGRPPKNLGQRFDLVVWEKSNEKIKAVIEIKKAWDITLLRTDQKKIATFLKQHEYVKSGYLLAYTDAKGVRRENTLSNRLDKWAQGLSCSLVGFHIDKQGSEEWSWAIGLFRLPRL